MWIPIVSIKRHTAYSFTKSLVQHFSVLQWVRVQIGRFDRKIQKKPREESSLCVHPKSHCFWTTLPLEVSDGACLKYFLGDDGISTMSDAHTHWKHTDGYNAKKFCVGTYEPGREGFTWFPFSHLQWTEIDSHSNPDTWEESPYPAGLSGSWKDTHCKALCLSKLPRRLLLASPVHAVHAFQVCTCN